LALSGGAARALSHIGVLKVLEELGVDIKAIAGTSMGSIIGAFFCSGVKLQEIEAYVRAMDWKSFLLFSELAFSKTGIINWRRVEEELKKFLGDKTFSDCRIQFCCTVVDLITSEKVILSEGKLLDAVRASIAIPGFFSAVCMGDRILVDGGIVEPLPTASLKTMDVDFIIASSIAFERDREKYIADFHENNDCSGSDEEDQLNGYKNSSRAVRGKLLNFKNRTRQKQQNKKRLSIRNVLDTSFSIMQREMTKNFLNMADIIIEPEVGDFGFFDLIHGSEIIQRGVEAARSKVPEIKRKLGL
jgi:NTE family protein